MKINFANGFCLSVLEQDELCDAAEFIDILTGNDVFNDEEKPIECAIMFGGTIDYPSCMKMGLCGKGHNLYAISYKQFYLVAREVSSWGERTL